MGFFDELKKLTRPYDDEDDEDFYEDGLDEEPARNAGGQTYSKQPDADRSSSFTPRRDPFAGLGEVPPPSMQSRERPGKVVSINAKTNLQVVICKPERFENARDIADHLRERRTVLINFEKTEKEIMRRLLDFLSGVAYAQDGKIQKVAAAAYIITPYNVETLGDLIDELESSGLYL